MKSKLSLIVVFLAVFTFSLAMPYGPSSLVNPPEAEATATARATCKAEYNTGGQDAIDACIIGYNGGYAGKSVETACGDPDGRHVSGITYSNTSPTPNYPYCTGGWQFGNAQRKEDKVPDSTPSGQDLNERAEAACSRYGTSGDKAEACQRGYKAAYASGATSASVTTECNRDKVGSQTQTEEMKTACRYGVEKANRNNIEAKEPSAGAKQVAAASAAKQAEARKECEKEKYTGSEMDACIDGYVSAKAGVEKEKACSDYPANSKRKAACLKGYGAGGGDTSAEDQIDCDTKLESILSWIVCPVIDMGVAFTDWAFKDFIQPMLENVPVSTNPDDGSYKAWSQFRLIANILLVGSLLAIVYSQARGPK